MENAEFTERLRRCHKTGNIKDYKNDQFYGYAVARFE